VTRPERQHERDVAGHPEAGRLGGIVRRLRRGEPTPEERLSGVIESHRRELEERTRRFEETLADLERREQLLSDSRASVERLLRLGTNDLDAREADIARLVRDLTEREARLREQEEDLTHRRSELGAVELKRLAVEQRERAVEAREERAAAEEELLDLPSEQASPGAEAPVSLAFAAGARYALVEIDPRPLERGDTLVLDGAEHVVARVGPSPLPGDARSCAYLLPS
jgi:septal ring factor EnvC (AmiA/AmiB activator)